MRLSTFLTFFLLFMTLGLTGCVQPQSPYLAGSPLLILPDVMGDEDPAVQKKALDAYLRSLAKNNWHIRNIDRSSNTVVSYACRPGNHCAEIQASVRTDGTVSVIRTPGQILTLDEGNMLRQWIGKLQREYRRNTRFLR